MKKEFILIFSLLCSTLALAEYDDPIDLKQNLSTEYKSKKIFSYSLQKAWSTILTTPEKVKNSFNWVADNLDTILTKKGAIKALLILGPLFATYCYFFPPEPVKFLIRKIVGSSVSGGSEVFIEVVNALEENKDGLYDAVSKATQMTGEFQGAYEAAKEIGKSKGYFYEINSSWYDSLSMLVINTITKAIDTGIPFVLGAYTTKKFTK